MSVYWISFTLDNNSTYQKRWDALDTAVKDGATRWWAETAAFYIVEREDTLDELAQLVKDAIDEDVDIAVVRQDGLKAARIIGAYADQDIFRLFPYIKKF